MTRASGRIAVLACGIAILTGLAFSESAAAEHRGLFADVTVKRSNGYFVGISAVRWRHPQRPGKVTVVVSTEDSFSVYTAHAMLTRHRLKANLGSFGAISLRYHPRARTNAAQTLGALPPAGSVATTLLQRFLGCAQTLEGTEGRFKGRIRFRGEGGYVSVRAHRSRGILSPATASCSKPDPIHGVALDAKSDSVTFEADHFRRQRGAFFIAKQREKAGRVTIRRYALGGGRGRSFTYDSGLSSAHVKPITDAFSGSAELTPAGEWTGPLAASFPGAPDVPLAGAGFTARLGRF